jgi:replicative DNA helicase
LNIQRQALVKFIRLKDTDGILKLQNDKFTGEHLRILRFTKDYVMDNKGKLPTRNVYKRHFPSFSTDLKRTVKEPVKYLLQEIDNAHTHNTLVDMVTEVQKQLKNKGEIAPSQVLKNLEKQMLNLRSDVSNENEKGQDITKQRKRIRDKMSERRKQGGVLGFHLPFPSLTKFLRGLRKKRLYTLIARTSVGKTTMSFQIAMHVWKVYNVPVLFLSGELDYEQIEDMYLSYLTGISIDKIENGDLSDKDVELIDAKLKEVESKAPFIFGFAGSYADVVTELNLHAPEMLFVDSFYELDRFNEPDDTKRTSLVVSRLQRVSRDYNIPVFINSQANRATDKNHGAGLHNISFSDTIGQTSDVVMSLNQTDDMKLAREMEIGILKNRGGRLCRLLINWNFQDNDFTEIKQIDELSDGLAEDTSDLTNDDVQAQAEQQSKFDKLLGRDRKKKKDKRHDSELQEKRAKANKERAKEETKKKRVLKPKKKVA